MHKTLLLLLFAAIVIAQNGFTGYPVVTRSGNSYAHVGLNNKLYTFTLPSLNLYKTFVLSNQAAVFYNPATVSGDIVILSQSESGAGTYNVNFQAGTFTVDNGAAQPTAQYTSTTDSNTQQTDAQGNVYSYTLTGTDSYVTKTAGGRATNLNLPKTYNAHGIFSLQNGVLYLTATTFSGRGSVDFDYYAIDAASFAIIDGPVTLPNTATSGCPVPPRNCDVPVLVHFSIIEGTVLYVWTRATQGQPFQVNVETYRKSCGITINTFTDTSAPAATGSGGTCSGSSTCQTASYCAPGVCACNGACYSPTQYCCQNNQLTQIAFCTSTTGSSGSSTSTPTTTGTSICQTASYCATGVCACNGACYSPTQYCCQNNQLTQIAFCGTGGTGGTGGSSGSSSSSTTAPNPTVDNSGPTTSTLTLINNCDVAINLCGQYGGPLFTLQAKGRAANQPSGPYNECGSVQAEVTLNGFQGQNCYDLSEVAFKQNNHPITVYASNGPTLQCANSPCADANQPNQAPKVRCAAGPASVFVQWC